MHYNAYILDWTMNNYDQFKKTLVDSGYSFVVETGTEHIRVAIPFERFTHFARLCQTHLTEPYNYVDIQFPHEKTTVIVFRKVSFVITDPHENEKVKQWAIDLGLPPEQADWSTSFEPYRFFREAVPPSRVV
jgi:hypothetical protein